MCGICGYLNKNPNSHDQEILNKMLTTLNHRGPDDSGTYIDVNNLMIGLAQTRLSIIDTSKNGHQPMHFEHLSIVFNGEIYNYREIKKELISLGHYFINETDTEVILHAHDQWGELAVNKFIGMFSYVIFNKKNNKLFCYRDRVGVKPFYYYFDNKGLFLFSSELKAFHQHPQFNKNIDNQSVTQFFKLGYIPAPATIFQNTYKLEAGHYLVYDIANSNFEITKYWDINHFYEKPSIKMDYEEAKLELEKLLISSCQYRMIADVPVGVFLSGGYDSTLVTSILQKNNIEKIKTFTIGFENGTNEAPFAKKIAEHLNTEHTELYCNAKDAKEILLDLPYYYDEPFADNSAIPTIMVSKLAKQKVTVALSADGGDELFAGYEHYRIINRNLVTLGKIPDSGKKTVKAFTKFLHDSIPNNLITVKHKLNGFSETVNLPVKSKVAKLYEQMSYLPSYYLNNLLTEKKDGVENAFSANYSNFENYLTIPLAIDFKIFLQNDILTKVDRASMSVGLEAREPLLDHRLVEFVCQIPYNYKFDGLNLKKILKDITNSYIPKELLDRPKTGFTPPINDWLKNEFVDVVNHYFSEEQLEKSGFLNVTFAIHLKNEFFNGKLYYKQTIWRILQFQLWFEKWGH